jgi:hypothetical protein
VNSKKKVKSAFQIRDNTITYASKTFESDIMELKKNNNSWGEVVFEVVDKVAYFQHKYLHGFLLPDIMDALGETDPEYVKQFILKPKFLFRPVTDWKEIPNKYANKCRIIIEDNKVTGYVPSTTTLKYDEMKAFLVECENFLFYGLNGSIGVEKQEDAKLCREMAEMPEIIYQQELFEEE